MFLNFVLNKVVFIQEALLFEPVSSFCFYLHFCSCIDLVFTERQRLNLIFGLYAVTKKKKNVHYDSKSLRYDEWKPCLCTWKRNKGSKLTITGRQIAGNRLISLSRKYDGHDRFLFFFFFVILCTSMTRL